MEQRQMQGIPQGGYSQLPAPAPRKKRSLHSAFTGTCGKYLFLRLGCLLLALIPIIGLPNSICILERYHCKNTQIVGIPLEFKGKSGNLLGQLIKWGFLSIITLTIYGWLCVPVRFQQWKTANTVFGPVMV